MNFETALQIVSDAMFVQFGRRLHDVEMLLFKGAWDGQTYEVIAEISGYSPSYLTRIAGPKFWQNLSQALAEKVGKTSFRAVLEQQHIRSVNTPLLNEQPLSLSGSSSVSSASKTQEPPCIDWGEAPDVTTFYGRQAELDTLQQWVVNVRCRLSAVLGMGGIGKTSLTAKFVETLVEQSDCPFNHIIWRTLRNAPSVQELLTDLVPFLSDQRDTDITRKRLLHWLQQSQCLLILDNLETILQGGDRTGYFRSGYEDYGELLQLVAETRHQSCVVLTSREKPAVVGVLEGIDNPVRSLRLSGSPEAALSLINTKGLLGTEEEKYELGDRYNNSPLALKIVATSIQSLFDGKISLFLAEDTLVFNGLQRLLNQQFERLSELEKTVMY
ncbi:MAG: NACHT domain-containing protein, partial [Microcoleaceae cyanobacterium]